MMVMFKARSQPLVAPRPFAAGTLLQRQQQQQPQPQPQPVPPHTPEQPAEAPPIEQERGPQYPVREPGPGNPPERVRDLVH